MTHSDHGTVLNKDDAAIVAKADGSLELLLPSFGDDDPIPTKMMLLAAVLIRSRDDEWVADMLEEMEQGAS